LLAGIIFAIKLLDLKSILYVTLPVCREWTNRWISILLLYVYVFEEIFAFYTDFDDKIHLICNNKKKLSNEVIYKKLMFIMSL